LFDQEIDKNINDLDEEEFIPIEKILKKKLTLVAEFTEGSLFGYI
jgi:hypothetical protein